jgi:hypothetical protein
VRSPRSKAATVAVGVLGVAVGAATMAWVQDDSTPATSTTTPTSTGAGGATTATDGSSGAQDPLSVDPQSDQGTTGGFVVPGDGPSQGRSGAS